MNVQIVLQMRRAEHSYNYKGTCPSNQHGNPILKMNPCSLQRCWRGIRWKKTYPPQQDSTPIPTRVVGHGIVRPVALGHSLHIALEFRTLNHTRTPEHKRRRPATPGPPAFTPIPLFWSAMLALFPPTQGTVQAQGTFTPQVVGPTRFTFRSPEPPLPLTPRASLNLLSSLNPVAMTPPPPPPARPTTVRLRRIPQCPQPQPPQAYAVQKILGVPRLNVAHAIDTTARTQQTPHHCVAVCSNFRNAIPHWGFSTLRTNTTHRRWW